MRTRPARRKPPDQPARRPRCTAPVNQTGASAVQAQGEPGGKGHLPARLRGVCASSRHFILVPWFRTARSTFKLGTTAMMASSYGKPLSPPRTTPGTGLQDSGTVTPGPEAHCQRPSFRSLNTRPKFVAEHPEIGFSASLQGSICASRRQNPATPHPHPALAN